MLMLQLSASQQQIFLSVYMEMQGILVTRADPTVPDPEEQCNDTSEDALEVFNTWHLDLKGISSLQI